MSSLHLKVNLFLTGDGFVEEAARLDELLLSLGRVSLFNRSPGIAQFELDTENGIDSIRRAITGHRFDGSVTCEEVHEEEMEPA